MRELTITDYIFSDNAPTRHLIQPLLSNLSNTYAHTVCAQAPLGSSIAASLALLSQSGGKVVVFGSCLPKIGLGMLCKLSTQGWTLFTDQSWQRKGRTSDQCIIPKTNLLSSNHGKKYGKRWRKNA